MAAARLAIAIGAALGIAACEKPEAPPAAEPSQSAPAARADLSETERALDLFGAWLIQSVGTPSPVSDLGSWDMVLLVGTRELEVLSQCIGIGLFEYGRPGVDEIVVRQASAPPRSPEAGPLPAPVVCARTRTPAEQAIPHIFLSAREVRRESDGSVLISGPAGALTLRRPSGALDNPRGEAPPPSVPPLLGAWRFVSIDGRGLAERMELLLRPSKLEWRSGCVNEVRALRREEDKLIPGETDPFPVCERGRSQTELALGSLFADEVEARMAADGKLSLRGSGVTAELVPLTR